MGRSRPKPCGSRYVPFLSESYLLASLLGSRTASLSFSPMSGASKGQSPQSAYQTCVPPREFFLQ